MRAETAISNAATYAGIKALGSPLDGDTLAYGLSVLNSMLDSWRLNPLYIPCTEEVVATVTGSPISIGAGQTINVTRPKYVRNTSFIRMGGSDYYIRWIQEAEFNEIQTKNVSSIPCVGYYDGNFPVGHIYLYPKPVNAELHLQLDTVLPQFQDYTTDYPIDIGYQEAIELTLAERLCIGIRNIPNDLKSQANIARNRIINVKPGILKTPSYISASRTNISTNGKLL